jgi:hypothetical protein
MFFFPINLFSSGFYLEFGIFLNFQEFFDVHFFKKIPFTIILFNFLNQYSFSRGKYSFLTFNLLFHFLIL